MRAILLNNPGYTYLQKKVILLAFEEIKKCPEINKSRHCSIICKGKKIIATGINYENRTHPLSNKIGNTVHSELAAIMSIRHFEWDFRKFTLFNVRFNRFNEVVNSKPCSWCEKLILAYEIKDVYFTNNVGEFEKWNLEVAG